MNNSRAIMMREKAITCLELTKGFLPEQRDNSIEAIEELSGYILELTNNLEMNNSIFTIQPYLLGGTQWVFDDPTTDLVREAFVAGADTLLDKMANGKKQVTVLFSDKEFKGYDLMLELENTTPMGSDYFCRQLAHDLWLCPALYKYYPIAPKNIFIKIKS